MPTCTHGAVEKQVPQGPLVLEHPARLAPHPPASTERSSWPAIAQERMAIHARDGASGRDALWMAPETEVAALAGYALPDVCQLVEHGPWSRRQPIGNDQAEKSEALENGTEADLGTVYGRIVSCVETGLTG
jgi:hypothetical protein